MAPTLPGAKILVVDDDPYVRRSLQAVLETEGYRIITAQHGIEGLRLLQEEHPALVILAGECRIWTDGRRVNECVGFSAVPILILTARQSEVDRLRGLQAGATDYLLKPISLSELYAQIRTALELEPKSPR